MAEWFVPKQLEGLPGELISNVLSRLSVGEVIMFACAYVASSQFSFFVLKEKLRICRFSWTNAQKSSRSGYVEVVGLITVLYYFVERHFVQVDSTFPEDDGFCYLSETDELDWIFMARECIGKYPSPWLVNCFYASMSSCYSIPTPVAEYCHWIRRRILPVPLSYENLLNTAECLHCKLEVLRMARAHQTGGQLLQTKLSCLVFKEVGPGKYHLCGFNIHHNLDRYREEILRDIYGFGTFTTLHHLKQRESYYSGVVGVLEKVDVDLHSEVTVRDFAGKVGLSKQGVVGVVNSDLARIRSQDEAHTQYLMGQKSSELPSELEPTVMPDESASCVTPRPLGVVKQVDRDDMGSIVSKLTSQIATMRVDLQKMTEKKIIGDYTRTEYDEDLSEAFESSGVVNHCGQLLLKPPAHTSACELVPKMTVDDRLNFLIRLHTAIFKVVDNTSDYPRPGIMADLKSVSDGALSDEHPSFDLLQIVMTDTFDWSHFMVKNNNFLLPVLERGMRLNERIVATCLVS
jgi:hypothetical protein